MTHRRLGALFGAALIAMLAVGVVALESGAGAATRISEPKDNPVHVALDAQGKPVPFTITAEGFPAGRQAFVEQCDGRPTSAPHWSTTIDCDLGGSPSPAIIDAHGTATFSATDLNHRFVPVMGESPESLFNCVQPGAPAATNGLTNYTTCQIRVSTNNTQSTDDQVFTSIVFGSGSASGSGSSSGSSSTGVIVAIVAIVIVALIAGFVLARRGRSRVGVS